MNCFILQRTPEAGLQSEAGIHPHTALWPASSDRHLQDCAQPHPVATDVSAYARSHLLQVPATGPWTAHTPSTAGAVISPLEKKKRLAQASLNLPLSPQGDDKERPSVIHCRQSPTLASSGRNCNSSEGSPRPLSSSSSRSPSPYSVSSEDSSTVNVDKPASSSEFAQICSSTLKNTSSSNGEKSLSCSQISKDPAGQNRDMSRVSSQTVTADLVHDQIKDSAWKPVHKGGARNLTLPFYSSFNVKSDWAPTSTSSFTKVIPKSLQLPRPAPIRPGYKIQQNRLMYQSNAKKPKNMAPSLYHTEKRDKSRTIPQKFPPTQQSLFHTTAGLPVSCVLSSFDKSGRDSRHQPPMHPAFLLNRMRIPQSQHMYHHVPVSPAPSALIGPAIYPYPYSFPLWGPNTAYSLPAMNPIYPHKP